VKIYNKRSFVWGMLFLCFFALSVLGVLETKGWPRVITLAFAAKFLYAGLSKGESERQARIAEHYGQAARELFGKHAAVKTNLPWIMAGAFFAIALLVRFVLGVVVPVWVLIGFAVVLTLSAFYSMGVNRAITDHIDRMEPEEEKDP